MLIVDLNGKVSFVREKDITEELEGILVKPIKCNKISWVNVKIEVLRQILSEEYQTRTLQDSLSNEEITLFDDGTLSGVDIDGNPLLDDVVVNEDILDKIFN